MALMPAAIAALASVLAGDSAGASPTEARARDAAATSLAFSLAPAGRAPTRLTVRPQPLSDATRSTSGGQACRGGARVRWSALRRSRAKPASAAMEFTLVPPHTRPRLRLERGSRGTGSAVRRAIAWPTACTALGLG